MSDHLHLPQNLEAERSVLGAVLVHNEALSDAIDRVRPEDFYRDANQRIFRHMLQLSLGGTAIDLVTLWESLSRSGELDAIGGAAYVTALADGVPRSANVGYYAEIVREKSRLRKTITIANRMLSRAYAAEDDARTVVDAAERMLFELAAGDTRGGLVHVSVGVKKTFDVLEQWHQARDGITGVPTGLREIDTVTSGLQPGHLIILAARPSQGKSALAQNIAFRVAQQVGPVAYFTIEMDDTEVVLRQLAAEMRLDSRVIQRGRLTETQWGRLSEAFGEVSSARLFIDESSSLNALEIRARARRLKAEHGLALVVVDYLQLMDVDEVRGDNRNEKVGVISRAMKSLAKELHVPALVLSQLNRGPELRSDHRPMLSDLRDSGTLEQDANVVMFLYRDEWYHDPTPQTEGIAELIIAKQRAGPLATVKLRFVREETRFEDLPIGWGETDRPSEQQQLPTGDR